MAQQWKKERISKTGIESLRQADVIFIDHFADTPDMYHIVCEIRGRKSWIHSGVGIMFYRSAGAARRAVRRVRPGYEPIVVEF